MVLSDIARAMLILMMPFSAARSPAFIYLVAGCIGIFSALFSPSQVKAVADLCRPQQLVKANSYLSIVRDGESSPDISSAEVSWPGWGTHPRSCSIR